MLNPMTCLLRTRTLALRTVTLAALVMLPACLEKVPLAQDDDAQTMGGDAQPDTAESPDVTDGPDGSDGGPDTQPDAQPDAPTRSDTLAECFEIFPEGDGTGTAHTNPLEYTYTITLPTQVKTARIRYYNLCSDPDARVLSVELLGIDGAAPDPAFTITEAPEPGAMITGPTQAFLSVRFAPLELGTHRVIARLHTSHGYYETRFTGEVFAP